MSLDGKILNNALACLHKRKADRESELLGRCERVYRQLPRVKQLDDQLRETMLDTIARALRTGGDPEAELEIIQQRNLGFQEERRQVLESGGYTVDYLDDKPMCQRCGDAGFYRGAPCSCLMETYKRLQTEELSSLIKLGEETFDTFRLDYYDNAVKDQATGETPRANMEFNYELCYNYAHKFGENSMNLFLMGGTGLGKTFLSTCIAKVVSDKGYSVVYDTAANVFSKFEAEKFSRSYGDEHRRDETERYLKCDLLILDDLGTEMTTSFVVSALYSLINSRLISGRKTIISSNITLEELRRKYSDQIMSRLEGEYTILSFYGQDIRRLKKNL